MKNLSRLVALTGAMALSLGASPIAAQSAEETINVGLELNVGLEDPVISGLEDISLSLTETPTVLLSVSDLQIFCVFTPTRLFTMTATSFQGLSVGGRFRMFNDLAPEPDISYVIYNVVFRDAFSGTDASLGTFLSGTPVSGIDSSPFNLDPSCSDGENVSLEVSITGGDSEGSGLTNAKVLEQFGNGVAHNFNDQLTILIEPDI